MARLRTHGAELVGDLARYEESYRLCSVRGPQRISVGPAEQLSRGPEEGLIPADEG